MSALIALKLNTAKKSQAMTPAVHRRLKLSKTLWEQIELAKVTSTGGTYTVRCFKTIRDEEGNSRSVELPKKVLQWWWNTADGKLALNIRYGARVIELAKGKSAIEMATMDDLVPTLELIKRAWKQGSWMVRSRLHPSSFAKALASDGLPHCGCRLKRQSQCCR